MELTVGRVVKAHGVTGELVVDIRTDDPELRFAPGSTLRAKGSDRRERSYTVDAVRPHGGRLLVRLSGVADRDTADELRGSVFVIDSADADEREAIAALGLAVVVTPTLVHLGLAEDLAGRLVSLGAAHA